MPVHANKMQLWTLTKMPYLGHNKLDVVNARDINLIITVPTDYPAPNGAGPSAGTALTNETAMIFFQSCFRLSEYNIQNDQHGQLAI